MKTTKMLPVIFCLVLLFSVPLAAVEKAGVTVPETIKVGEDELILNGTGIRKKFGFKAYVAALYLEKKTTVSENIINADEKMSFTMTWLRVGDDRKINLVFFKSFAISVKAPVAKIYTKNSDYGVLSEKIVQFMAWVSTKATARHDVWTYKYVPGEGTHVYIYHEEKKSEEYMGVIPGLEFKKALLRIWLGERQAVGEKMKKDLLGL